MHLQFPQIKTKKKMHRLEIKRYIKIKKIKHEECPLFLFDVKSCNILSLFENDLVAREINWKGGTDGTR